MRDGAHDLDSEAGRLRALASALYYLTQMQQGAPCTRVYDALPWADQLFFERVGRLAVAAAGSWRMADDPAPAPLPARVRLVLVGGAPMSDCRVCGRHWPADRETGADADDLCPDCEAPVCGWCGGALPRETTSGYCDGVCEAQAQNDSEAG